MHIEHQIESNALIKNYSLVMSQTRRTPVVIYTTQLCGFCHAAKRLLDTKQIPFEEIPADGNAQLRHELVERSGGQRTVPQIWIGDTHVGGYTDLAALAQTGELDTLLSE